MLPGAPGLSAFSGEHHDNACTRLPAPGFCAGRTGVSQLPVPGRSARLLRHRLWDGTGDTLYAFEDRGAFESQRATAERHFVHVHELFAEEAAGWIAAGGNAVLHEVSAADVAAFENLKLAPG
ncbi:hypothetical protein [Agrobacterium tumefaciens]|uniref:hypothetical protein n=1 Tax=Agrobacterium tumefaciens TaxID=358 RepID=UPI002FDC2329